MNSTHKKADLLGRLVGVCVLYLLESIWIPLAHQAFASNKAFLALVEVFTVVALVYFIILS